MARRFQISVPKRRGVDDPWFRVGTIDVTTGVFLIGLNVFSMLLYAINREWVAKLVLFRPFVANGQLWRLFTWPFASTPSFNSAITLAFFWFMSREVERLFGRIRFTKFLITIAVIVTALALALDVAVIGPRLLVTATFIAFVAENPRMPFFFGIPAWVIAAVYLGLDILQYLGDREPELLILLLASAGAALLLLRGYGWGTEVPWVPKLPIPELLGGPARRKGSAAARPAARTKPTKPTRTTKNRGKGGSVVSGPWGETGTGSASGPAPQGPPVSRLSRTGPVTQADVDRVLDKVAATGLNSLTDDEKAILEDASRKLRERGDA